MVATAVPRQTAGTRSPSDDGWAHSTITVTMDRYGHLLPSLEADLITRSSETFTASLVLA